MPCMRSLHVGPGPRTPGPSVIPSAERAPPEPDSPGLGTSTLERDRPSPRATGSAPPTSLREGLSLPPTLAWRVPAADLSPALLMVLLWTVRHFKREETGLGGKQGELSRSAIRWFFCIGAGGVEMRGFYGNELQPRIGEK